ncbi:hypothetical protein [Bradyrhizobium sp. BR 1432]|uniref:hypothetical protein n=1 Tax=Bradyrhizobium sp. BR 1432 TaxID=3447966 RepID=UPI003EE77977
MPLADDDRVQVRVHSEIGSSADPLLGDTEIEGLGRLASARPIEIRKTDEKAAITLRDVAMLAISPVKSRWKQSSDGVYGPDPHTLSPREAYGNWEGIREYPELGLHHPKLRKELLNRT